MQDLYKLVTEFDLEALGTAVQSLGGWSYLVICAIVFLETAVVVLPFLPGDSLLFFIGILAGEGSLNPWWCFVLLATAAVIGDSVGYGLGCVFRDTLAQGKRVRLISPKHLRTTQLFYERHGAKTIMMARFVPIVRAFAPFCAGLARMPYKKMLHFSVIGSIIWVGSLVWAGYFLGQIPMVRTIFPWLAGAVIIGTCVAVVREVIMQLRDKGDTTGGPVNPPPPDGAAVTAAPGVGGAPGAAATVTAASRPDASVRPHG